VRIQLLTATAGIACVACAAAPPTPQAHSPSPDLGIAFNELNEAAKAGCEWLWKHEPNAQRWEYCGALYKDKDGIRVTRPMTVYGGSCGSPRGPPHVPEGTQLLGKYHSHRLTPEPSFQDRQIAAAYPSLGHFLCAPSGIVRRFSAAEGTVIVR
jgi:proteasome lid subunit RPN8/RPN11